jgi:hypothetical protein
VAKKRVHLLRYRGWKCGGGWRSGGTAGVRERRGHEDVVALLLINNKNATIVSFIIFIRSHIN